MSNITVHRYPVPSAEERSTWPDGTMAVSDAWQGWIEPDDRSWIVFVDATGAPTLYLNRDQSGAVL